MSSPILIIQELKKILTETANEIPRYDFEDDGKFYVLVKSKFKEMKRLKPKTFESFTKDQFRFFRDVYNRFLHLVRRFDTLKKEKKGNTCSEFYSLKEQFYFLWETFARKTVHALYDYDCNNNITHVILLP